MRIAIITHVLNRNDGQGRVNYEIALKLARSGHMVTLVSSKVAPELMAEPNIQCALISSSRLPGRLLRYQEFALRTTSWLARHRKNFDIVHVNGGITYAASDINSVHFVHSGWRSSPYYSVSPGLRGYYHRFFTALNAVWERNAFSKSQAIVAVSQKIAVEIAQHTIGRKSAHVILNGVDTEEFYPGLESRQELLLPENVFLAFFAGDIRSERKNLRTVLHSLLNVPSVHLAIAGATEGSPFPQLASDLGLSDRVHFLGMRKDMPKLMRACDVFVFPSRYEACSLVLLEALSSGMPVIAASTVGGCEIMSTGSGIILEDPNDSAALSRHLLALSTSPELLNNMGIRAREIAGSYTWDAMAQRYIELYQKQLSQS